MSSSDKGKTLISAKQQIERQISDDKSQKQGNETEPEETESASSTSTGSSSMTAGMNIDAVRKYLAEKLGFYDEDKEDKEKVKVSSFNCESFM